MVNAWNVLLAAVAVAPGVLGMSKNGEFLMNAKESYWKAKVDAGEYPRLELESSRSAAAVCPENGGTVTINGEQFPCKGVDFQSFISLRELSLPGQGGTTLVSDIWGWLSPDNREITLLCLDNGVWFIDTTNPEAPVKLGNLPTGRPKFAWCDIKVYKNVAYIVKDGTDTTASRTYGIEVFDLNRLNGLTGATVQVFTPDFVYRQHGKSHNVAIDTESGFLYSVGSNTCSGGLHIINLEPNPLRPTFSVCVSSDGYTHDAQCVVYDGPDTRFTGRQICFAYNEDTLTIWDVTNKNSVTQLGRRTYSTARYTHQGWLTKDMKYVLLDDELDERDNPAVSFTTTYIVDVSVLTNPVFVNTFVHPEVSIDHNLYIWGAIHAKGWGGNPPMQNPPSAKYAYLSNYVAGIKILDIENPLSVREVGKFDVAPDLTGNVFEGTWSNYMHPSGNLAVASIDRGLFILKPKMAFDAVTNAPTPAPTNFPTPSPTLPPNSPPVNPTAQPTTAFPTPLPTPAPTTAFPTPAPTECEDKNPSGLVYSGTNNPAPCSEIGSYCEDLQIVRDACPATCGLCPSECADKVPSGLQYSNGQAAPCTDFISGGTYCTMYAVVQEACPRTCGICTVLTSFKGLVPVNTMLPSFIEDPNGAKSARDFLMGAKEAEWSNLKEEGKLPNSKVFSAIDTPATCTNGQVIINGEVFTCDGIDFLSFMSLSDLFIQNIGGGGTTAGSDIWGWKSPISGKEVTIMCVDNGINFIDSTNPVSPIRMGFILSGRTPTSWCDVKVYQNTVYIVKDSGSPAQNYGIEVFDLLRLDNLTDAEMPFSFQPDFVYRQHGRSHNLAINTETGFLYSVGSNSCSSGLHMIDLANRLEPVFAGCASSDGYTHDAQCVIYRGPDLPHHGKEICFAFNEDTLTIWDVSVKATPTVLSRVSYNGFAYTHQGWLTKGMGYLLLDDELDERNGLVQTTRTHIWDVTVLTAPTRIGVYDHVDAAIDHNLYVWGEIHKYGWGGNPAMENPPSSNYAYLSNYVAGIRVLDICDVSTAKLTQKGFFDVSPDLTGNVFEGTWSNYMHPSGTLAVSSIDRGLFLLKPNMAFDSAECTVSTPTTPPTLPEEECVDTVPSGIKFNDGRPAECADIERFCSVYPVVQERCPLTCGSCGNPVCEDNVPSGLSYVDGTPAECSQIGVYCTVHSQVPVACPQTCGLCASNAKRVASFKGDSLISFVLDVGSEKKESNVLVVVTAILGVVCIGLATALLVSKRKKSVRSDKTEEAESFPEAQEVPLKVQMVKTNVAPTANPMFSEA